MKKTSLMIISAIFAAIQLSAQTKRPVVTGLQASASNTNKIFLSWNLPETEGSHIASLIVYRNTRPISDFSQTADLVPLAVLQRGTSSYVDTVSSMQDFFYAVVSVTAKGSSEKVNRELYYDEDLDQKEPEEQTQILKLILPGVNATVNGIHTQKKIRPTKKIEQQRPAEKEYAGALREQPLPQLDLVENKTPGTKISEEARNRAVHLASMNRLHSQEIMAPHIFEEDLISPAGGDDYLLFEILRESFVTKKYGESAERLSEFLKNNRSKSVTDRTEFYLGQSYYYSGRFEEALVLFLKLEDVYTTLCRKWIENTLNLYTVNKQ